MKRAAALCPLREKSGKLKVLLTRRSFWNPQKNKRMSFPGEWVFAGGNYEQDDESLRSTAIREFREEVGYKGGIDNVRLIYSGKNSPHSIEFYVAHIDPQDFKPQTGEVIDVQWNTPKEWLHTIGSDKFSDCQLRELRKYGLQARHMPTETISTLEYLNSMQQIILRNWRELK